MKNAALLLILISVLTGGAGCINDQKEAPHDIISPAPDLRQEKDAIIQTLNNETRAAFQRDYQAWQEYWVHSPAVSKTYINFADNSHSESIGWQEISRFVKEFIEAHPEPEPLPSLVDDIDVRLYDDGAWVSYQQQDSIRGRKRETRLMEKVDGQWKIAGMHTTIYGIDE
ncbi:nuclear transport factor 2 family protein [Roseivirga sp. BDSF3-8]|uniref:nuclear transport factor 2 family protein n=1 Tax=Roseivirga sp. BDSF3-8 TaxID=3241598 RepID=UPI0035318BE6